ncbi:MAG TPA: hypothetical protein PK459_06315 [Anaerolineaceae bacterium]|nr:hypothetical protein [Anaerolineaceae bacterium]HQC64697.1 hypothetical protein [Anaerolineaceae bacterium]
MSQQSLAFDVDTDDIELVLPASRRAELSLRVADVLLDKRHDLSDATRQFSTRPPSSINHQNKI